MKRKGTPITDEGMESLLSNITTCTNVSRAVAQYVYGIAKSSPGDWQSITITKQVKSEGCSAITVTTESSVGTQTQTFSDEWLNTLKGQPDGSPRRKNRE
jgi:hypothetical protein